MAETIKTYIVHLINTKTVMIAAHATDEPERVGGELWVYGEDGTTVKFNYAAVAYYRPEEYEMPSEEVVNQYKDALKPQDAQPQRYTSGQYL